MTKILEDGFKTLITFALNGNVKLEEKTVKPGGWDAGGLIDTTTMRNIRYRTGAGKQLLTLSPASVKVAYDPAVYNDMKAMAGLNQLIIITFPDGGHIDAYGIVDKFEPDDLAEGTFPTATLSILFTNENANGDESAPTFTPGTLSTTTTTTPAVVTTTTAAPAP